MARILFADAIAVHVERHLGSFDLAIPCDRSRTHVLHVPPARGRPFHTLVTRGLSETAGCELFTLLPRHWRIAEDSLHEERWRWPALALSVIGGARLSGNGRPPGPYAPDIRFTGAMATAPVSLPPEFGEIRRGDRTIPVHQVVFLYPEELSFARRHGPNALLARFAQYGTTDVLEPDRVNVCGRAATSPIAEALRAVREREAYRVRS